MHDAFLIRIFLVNRRYKVRYDRLWLSPQTDKFLMMEGFGRRVGETHCIKFLTCYRLAYSLSSCNSKKNHLLMYPAYDPSSDPEKT